MRYKSELTSIKHIPALLKHVNWKPHTVNLDWGGGKYVLGSMYLWKKGVANLIYDPYNSPIKDIVLSATDYDTVTLSNVLNVIASEKSRIKCVSDAFHHLKTHGKMYISVWQGNGDSKPTVSKQNSWQANRPLESYLKEIRKAIVGYDVVVVKSHRFKYIEITKRA